MIRGDDVTSVRRKHDAAGASVFETRRGAAFDLLIASDGRTVECERVASDFEWAWARFDESDALSELVLVEGRRCAVDGQTIFEGRERAAWAVVSRDGDEFVVETDEGRERIAASESLAGVGR